MGDLWRKPLRWRNNHGKSKTKEMSQNAWHSAEGESASTCFQVLHRFLYHKVKATTCKVPNVLVLSDLRHPLASFPHAWEISCSVLLSHSWKWGQLASLRGQAGSQPWGNNQDATTQLVVDQDTLSPGDEVGKWMEEFYFFPTRTDLTYRVWAHSWAEGPLGDSRTDPKARCILWPCTHSYDYYPY